MNVMIKRAMVGLVSLLMAVTLIACSTTGSGTVIEMELSQNYDTSDPFVNEKAFFVSDDIDTLQLDATFEMQGETAILEIEDDESDEVVWSDEWNGTVGKTEFVIPLDGLEKDKVYTVRLTGYEIEHAKLVITSEDNLVKERERPQRPDKS